MFRGSVDHDLVFSRQIRTSQESNGFGNSGVTHGLWYPVRIARALSQFRKDDIQATEKRSMTTKASTLKTSLIPCLLAGAFFSANQTIAQSDSPPVAPTNPPVLPTNPLSGKASGAAQPSASKLTPEERQRRKEAKELAEMQAEQLRMDTYGVIPEDDLSPLAAEYRQSYAAFKESLVAFADAHARIQYRMGEAIPNEAREKWLEGLQGTHRALVKWRANIAKLYGSAPEKYSNLGLLLSEMLVTDGNLDRLDDWSTPARTLLEAKLHVDDQVLLFAGYAGFMNCDFELAQQAWGSLQQAGKLPEQEARMLQEIPTIALTWETEKQRREEDKQKENPRVEIMTTKGTMIIELFEDDAPESVANFIYLVENGYYTRKPFFLVKQHWLAQTGCEKGDGKGSAGFTIKSEAQLPTRRNHFRGSLAVPIGFNAQTQETDFNSGGAQFYFSFLPLPLVDGRHTVFGRIESGMEVLGMLKVLNLTDEEERKNQELRPDTIIRATVLKKRNHDYRPTPVFGKLPR